MNVFRKNTSKKSSAQSIRDVSQRNQIFRLTKADKVLDKKSVDNIIEKLTDLRVDPDGLELFGSKKSSASSSKNSVYEADKYLPLLKYTNF